MYIYFFVSLSDFFFFLVFVFVFAVWNPDATKWTLIVALRISSINKSCFKSHYVKQDLKISEGILAMLYDRQWGPPLIPFELPVECPAPLGHGLTVCKTLCAKILSDFSFLPLFDAVIFVHHVLLWCYIGRFVCSFNVTYNKMCLIADCPESILNEEV